MASHTQMPLIVIGFAESLAAPEVAWSLLDGGFRVAAITRRGCKPALRHCKSVQILEVTAPEADALRALDELKQTLANLRAWAVMPMDDATVWLLDQISNASHDLPFRILGPTGEQAALALDKRLQLAAAREAGFLVPETQGSSNAGEARGIEPFPCIVKPALAAELRGEKLTRGKAHVCADRPEFESALAAIPSDQPILVQAILHGTGEGLFGLCTEAGVTALSAHRRLRMMNPQGSGSSACVSIAVDPVRAAAAEKMMTRAGWRGMFMIELLVDREGRAWFMELNGRAWGSMALARRMGFEYPAWSARTAFDPEFIPRIPQVREGIVCRNLGREILHLLMVLRGPKSKALAEWPPRGRTLIDLLRVGGGQTWYNWHRGDRAVFWADAWQTASEPFVRKLRRLP